MSASSEKTPLTANLPKRLRIVAFGQAKQRARLAHLLDEAADEIDRLRDHNDVLVDTLRRFAEFLSDPCALNVTESYCHTHDCEIDDSHHCIGAVARLVLKETLP